MERKNVNAILVNEFKTFLKEKGLYEDFTSGKVLCSKCSSSITSENIAMIYYHDDEYRFRCDNTDCLEKIN